MAMLSVLNNPILTLQLGILGKLLGLMGRIVKGCVREVCLAQVSMLYICCSAHTSGCVVNGLGDSALGIIIQSLLTVAKFTLTQAVYKTAEGDGYVVVCVELKSCIRRNVTLYLEYAEGSAVGEHVIAL